MCHTPDRSRGSPSGAQQLGTVHGRSLIAIQEVSRVYANGKCWKGLVEAISSLFSKAFVCVATSVEHPGGTSSVSVFYQSSACALVTVLHSCGVPRRFGGILKTFGKIQS